MEDKEETVGEIMEGIKKIEKRGIVAIAVVILIAVSIFTYGILYNKGIICFPDCDSCTPKHPCGVVISGIGDSAEVIVTKGDEIRTSNFGGGCG